MEFQINNTRNKPKQKTLTFECIFHLSDVCSSFFFVYHFGCNGTLAVNLQRVNLQIMPINYRTNNNNNNNNHITVEKSLSMKLTYCRINKSNSQLYHWQNCLPAKRKKKKTKTDIRTKTNIKHFVFSKYSNCCTPLKWIQRHTITNGIFA